jgi:hypothetical protein
MYGYELEFTEVISKEDLKIVYPTLNFNNRPTLNFNSR